MAHAERRPAGLEGEAPPTSAAHLVRVAIASVVLEDRLGGPDRIPGRSSVDRLPRARPDPYDPAP